MGYRFLARCLFLCLICIVSGALLPLSTAYTAGPLRIYTFQITRPDPNRPESKGQVVQAVRIKYNLDDSAFSDSIVKCVKTPDQNWQPFKSTKSFKFDSDVEFKVYTNPDCSGADVTPTIYNAGAILARTPAKREVKADTCWMNLNVFPNGNLSGCNTGESGTKNSIKSTPTSPATYPVTVKIFRSFDSQVGAVRVTVNEHRDVLDQACIPIPKQDSELKKGVLFNDIPLPSGKNIFNQDFILIENFPDAECNVPGFPNITNNFQNLARKLTSAANFCGKGCFVYKTPKQA